MWRYCLWSAPSFASIQWDLSYALQEGRYCTSLKWDLQPLLEYEAPCWVWFPFHWQRWLSETHLGWPGRYSACYLSKNNNQNQGTEKSSELQIYEANVRCNRALFVPRLAEHTPTAVWFLQPVSSRSSHVWRAFYYTWPDDFLWSTQK